MRKTLNGLTIAGAVCLFCHQSAGAVSVDAAAIKSATMTAATVQQVQFSERRTRHRVVKCYRELVVGPYVCHTFYRR